MITATAVLATGAAAFADGEPEGEPHEPPGLATDATPTIHRATWAPAVEPAARPAGRRGVTGMAPPRHRNKRIAFRLVVDRTWSARQFRCLDSLWTRESNWNHRAVNRSSGAYGIPQALPAGKMADAGGDWRVNPATQIRWGLRYIESRYGSPCGAWGHFQAHSWY